MNAGPLMSVHALLIEARDAIQESMNDLADTCPKNHDTDSAWLMESTAIQAMSLAV